MAAADSPIALAGEFPSVERDVWEALAGDIDALRSTSYDDITIEPLYTAADDVPEAGLPGSPPFIRGRTAAGTRNGGWDVRQIVYPTYGAGLGLIELERGATSLLIPLRRVDTIDADLLANVLDGVLLDMAGIVLDAGRRWPEAAAALEALRERQNVSPAEASGSFGADPLGEWASERSRIDIDRHLGMLGTWAQHVASTYPNVRLVTIDGGRFDNAGASDAQELGYTIATAVATLRAIAAAGLDVADAFALCELRLTANADQFATIAKFRAARRLWARVAEVAGVPDAAAATPLHAVSSLAITTRYDAAVNMLRGTVACFAAGVAGADAITVRPYDHHTSPTGSELGRRLARNTQLLLSMESHIARVIDPAGGSWYVEQLTADLAAAAWDVFQEVEAAGGFRAAVAAGIVNERIATVRDRRRADVNRRRAAITGLTEFPNIDEVVPLAFDSPAGTPADGSLVWHRWTEDVETLRQRVDVAAAAGVRPAVFLATIGTPATFTARATFAKNFFEVVGIATRFGPVTGDASEIAAAFTADGATVACVCSSDDVYRERGTSVAEALAGAGASRVYLAGNPKNLLAALTEAGVTQTISAGADVVATLTDLAAHLGVA